MLSIVLSSNANPKPIPDARRQSWRAKEQAVPNLILQIQLQLLPFHRLDLIKLLSNHIESMRFIFAAELPEHTLPMIQALKHRVLSR